MTTKNPGGFKFKISGKVHGVFFRADTKKKAEELGVTGWIRRVLNDGTVEGEFASNDEQSRNEMKAWLQVGSPLSVIENTESESLEGFAYLHALLNSEGFEIRKSIRY